MDYHSKKILSVERFSEGKAPCSEDNSPYVRARQRLPEELLKELLQETGITLDEQSDAQWLWKGKPVKLVDGTTVSMPNTPENQKAYPQPDSQKPGLGFPIARLVQQTLNPYDQRLSSQHLALIGPFKWLGHRFIEIVDKRENFLLQCLL